MSRFTDALERDLNQIADRASPSSTAWAAIQQRVAEQTDEPEMEVIMLAPDSNERSTRTRRWYLAAAVVIGLALVGGLLVIGTRDDEQEPIPADQPAPVIQEQPLQGVAVNPGRYETDLLGMSMTYTVDREWQVSRARPAEVALSQPDSEGMFVQFTRLGGWFTGSEAIDRLYFGEGSIEPLDIDGWIASNEVIAAELPNVDLEGRTVRVFDVRIDPSSGADEIWYHSISAESVVASGPLRYQFPIKADEGARFWLVPVDGFDPILISATAPLDNSEFLDEADELVRTIDFGPDAPPPPPS